MDSVHLARALDSFLASIEPILKTANPEDLPGHVVADEAVPRWVKGFMQAVKLTQGKTAIKALEDAIARGDWAAAEAAIPWEVMTDALTATWRPAIISLLSAGAEAAAPTVPPPPGGSGLNMRFDITNPKAQAWADNHAAKLVTQITDESRAAVKGSIQRAFSEGLAPAQSARIIRQHVGLLDRHAAAVDRYRDNLISLGASESQAEGKAAKYAQKLINYRANNIARTETLAASNRGQLELWQQAQTQGYLGHERLMAWIVTDDDRLCDECAPMDGLTAPVSDGFPEVEMPPLHPSCRCAVSLTS